LLKDSKEWPSSIAKTIGGKNTLSL